MKNQEPLEKISTKNVTSLKWSTPIKKKRSVFLSGVALAMSFLLPIVILSLSRNLLGDESQNSVRSSYKIGKTKVQVEKQKDGSSLHTSYDEDGKLISKVKYFSDGSMKMQNFFKNGQISSESFCTNHYRDGGTKEYNSSGKLLSEQESKDGKLIKNEHYCNDVMEHIFVRWIPSPEPLSVKIFSMPNFEIGLKETEIDLLKKAGLTGKLEVRGSGGLSREFKASRVVFVFQKLIDKPTSLRLPDGGTVIYIQKDSDWQKVLENAATVERLITFEPDRNDSKYILYSSEMESGDKMGGGISLGI